MWAVHPLDTSNTIETHWFSWNSHEALIVNNYSHHKRLCWINRKEMAYAISFLLYCSVDSIYLLHRMQTEQIAFGIDR